MKKVNRFELLLAGFKLNFLHASWNFERLQNAGFLFSIYGILKKIYMGDKENFLRAIKRHIGFFNTHIFFSPAVAGVITRLEEDIPDTDPEAKEREIENTKMGIMGPLAAIGDSLFWSGLKPIALLLGAAIVLLANPEHVVLVWYDACIISLAVFNIPRIAIKNYLLFKAYYEYRQLFMLIQKIKFQDIMKSIKLIGMFVLAGFMAGYIRLMPNNILSVKLVDNFLFLGVFAIFTFSLKNKVSVSKVFASVIAASIIISYLKG